GAQTRRPRPSPAAGRQHRDSAHDGDVGGGAAEGGAEQLLGTLRQLLGRATGGTEAPAGEVAGGGETAGAMSSQELMSLLTQAQHQAPASAADSTASVQDVRALVTQLLSRSGGKSELNQVDEDVIN